MVTACSSHFFSLRSHIYVRFHIQLCPSSRFVKANGLQIKLPSDSGLGAICLMGILRSLPCWSGSVALAASLCVFTLLYFISQHLGN